MSILAALALHGCSGANSDNGDAAPRSDAGKAVSSTAKNGQKTISSSLVGDEFLSDSEDSCQKLEAGNYEYSGFVEKDVAEVIELQFRPDLFSRFEKSWQNYNKNIADVKLSEYEIFQGGEKNGVKIVGLVNRIRPCPRAGCDMRFIAYLDDTNSIQFLSFEGQSAVQAWALPSFMVENCIIQKVIFDDEKTKIRRTAASVPRSDAERKAWEQGLDSVWVRSINNEEEK